MDVDSFTDRMSTQLDAANERFNDRFGDRVDDLRGDVATQWHDLRNRTAATIAPEDARGRTWMGRVLWLLIGIATGVTAAFLADPDRGRARRRQLTDTVGSKARRLTDDVAGKADSLAGQAKGAVIETAKSATPDHPTADPNLLRQRIRSEVFGARDDVQDVVLRIDGPGEVALKGTIPTAEAERSLITQITEVAGVSTVHSELATVSS